jgi:hypothetical protein
MAIIASYPVASPEEGDYLLGTKIQISGQQVNPTANFTIESVRALVLGDKEISVQLTNAEVLDLATTSKLLIPAQGAGRYIEILSAAILFKEGSIRDTITYNDTIQFAIGTRSFGFVPSKTIEGNLVYLIDITAGTIEVNTPLVLQTSATSITGGGTIEVNIRYKVLDQTDF